MGCGAQASVVAVTMTELMMTSVVAVTMKKMLKTSVVAVAMARAPTPGGRLSGLDCRGCKVSGSAARRRPPQRSRLPRVQGEHLGNGRATDHRGCKVSTSAADTPPITEGVR